MENRGHITLRTNNFVTIQEDFVLYRHVEFEKGIYSLNAQTQLQVQEYTNKCTILQYKVFTIKTLEL
jgi:hypothetical protein